MINKIDSNLLLKRGVHYSVYGNYCEGDSLQDLLCNVFAKINEMITDVNTYTECIKKTLEWIRENGVEDAVKNELDKMLESGKFDDIISNTLFLDLKKAIEQNRKDIEVLEENVENKLNEFDNKVDNKLNEFDKKVDEKLLNFKELIDNINKEVEKFNEKIEKMKQENKQENDSQNEKISENADGIKKLNDVTRNLNFNLLKTTPSFFTDLKTSEGTVLQTLWIDNETDEMYTTQVWPGPKGSSESFGITHFDRHGNYIDWCRCKYGGHGTSLGLYKKNGKVYFFTNWDKVDSNGDYIGNDLVMFPYESRVTFEPNDSRFKKFDTFEETYMNPVVDQANDIIAFRVKYSEKNQVIKIRKLSEFMNGVDNLLAEFTIPPNLYYSQGFDICDDEFYWRTGDTNSKTSPDEIIVFNWRTGKIIQRQICDFGYPAKDNFREPEGLCVYKDPKTGLKSIICSLTTGEVGMRECNVYAYHEQGNFEKWEGLLKQTYQTSAFFDKDDLCFQVPKNLRKLSDLRKAGIFYMASDISKNISDLPKSAGSNSGYFIVNTPNNEFNAGEGKALVQKLIRNGVTSYDEWSRCLPRKEEGGKWYKTNVTAD